MSELPHYRNPNRFFGVDNGQIRQIGEGLDKIGSGLPKFSNPGIEKAGFYVYKYLSISSAFKNIMPLLRRGLQQNGVIEPEDAVPYVNDFLYLIQFLYRSRLVRHLDPEFKRVEQEIERKNKAEAAIYGSLIIAPIALNILADTDPKFCCLSSALTFTAIGSLVKHKIDKIVKERASKEIADRFPDILANLQQAYPDFRDVVVEYVSLIDSVRPELQRLFESVKLATEANGALGLKNALECEINQIFQEAQSETPESNLAKLLHLNSDRRQAVSLPDDLVLLSPEIYRSLGILAGLNDSDLITDPLHQHLVDTMHSKREDARNFGFIKGVDFSSICDGIMQTSYGIASFLNDDHSQIIARMDEFGVTLTEGSLNS